MAKQSGDPVFGATLNKTGSFRFAVTNVGFNTLLSQLVQLVENARQSRPLQRLSRPGQHPFHAHGSGYHSHARALV
ncbi:hypothetical protein ACFP2F_16805 [Hymenobacter artigasi]|uniref:P-type ATPase n=1 Tax=Hymenobacter artigasi TaxID=2719616 RepID=UPI00144572FD|nr:hypothetical protein [Hymenobacter artigasi]